MIDSDTDLLTVTDLKQYAYCARVSYYEHCLPDLRPRTYKMDAGQMAHEQERKRAARRTLRGYGLDARPRSFEVPVVSTLHGLVGKIDEVAVTERLPQQVIPVDYKLARQVSPHYRLQLAAYAMMLEESWQCQVTQGFVYLIPLRRLEPVPITDKLRNEVVEAASVIRSIIQAERMPPPTLRRSRCASCEFRRLCNDA